MKTITQTYIINAPIEKVWDALVNPQTIDQWGGGPAIMDDQVGTKFSLWGGDIFGTNTKVEPFKTLEQDWYGGKWEKASKVIITLSEDNGCTKVDLIHQDYPENSKDDFADGWKTYYFGPLKDLVEN